MLRVTWHQGGPAPHFLSETEMISKLQTFAAKNFADAPNGPVTVECIDKHRRVLWRSDYAQASQMLALLKQLMFEQRLAG